MKHVRAGVVAFTLAALSASAAHAAGAFAPVHIPIDAQAVGGIERASVDVTEEDGTKAHFEGVLVKAADAMLPVRTAVMCPLN